MGSSEIQPLGLNSTVDPSRCRHLKQKFTGANSSKFRAVMIGVSNGQLVEWSTNSPGIAGTSSGYGCARMPQERSEPSRPLSSYCRKKKTPSAFGRWGFEVVVGTLITQLPECHYSKRESPSESDRRTARQSNRYYTPTAPEFIVSESWLERSGLFLFLAIASRSALQTRRRPG